MLRYFVVLFAFAFVGGFGAFAAWTTNATPPAQAQADGVVALTGGGGARIATAAQLLTDGRAQRLLVSGVNPKTTAEDIRALAGAEAALFDCCVDLGRRATSTIGNAHEVAEWAREHGYTSLIVVTSDFHMPRSLIELRSVAEGVELIAYPVRANASGAYPWWRDPTTLRRLSLEYVKFVVILVRETVKGDPAAADR